MKLYIELYGDHITIRLLYEHRDFVVNNVRLTCLIVSVHEVPMLFLNQLRHKVLNSVALNLLLSPTKEHP